MSSDNLENRSTSNDFHTLDHMCSNKEKISSHKHENIPIETFDADVTIDTVNIVQTKKDISKASKHSKA